MAQKIKLEVVTPERFVVKTEAEIVMAPGISGEFGVLAGHTPFLTTLQVGTVHYKDDKGTERKVFVSGGFAEALPDKVTILAESAERRKDIDVQRAKSSLERARKRIDDTSEKSQIDVDRAKAALARALQRLKTADQGE